MPKFRISINLIPSWVFRKLFLIGIIALILFFIFNNISFAYDINDLYSYAELVSQSDTATTDQKYTANKIIQYWNKVYTYFTTYYPDINQLMATATNNGDVFFYGRMNEASNFTPPNSTGWSFYSFEIYMYKSNGNLGVSNNGNSSNHSIPKSKSFGFVNASPEITTFNGWWINFNNVSRFKYQPTTDTTSAITYNDYNNVYVNKYDYSLSNWNLGQIKSDINSFYQYKMLLYDGVSTNIVASNTFVPTTNQQTRNNMSLDNIYKVYVNSYLLQYNKIYSFIIYAIDESNTIKDSYQCNYLFLPTNAVITGNTIDSLGSGDYSTQNSTQALIGALTNSNYSGDISLSDLPLPEIEDSSSDFFEWLLTQIQSFFTNFNNTNLVIPIYNEEFTIPSNIFVFNTEPLASFISVGWWFICGIPLLKWVRKTIEHIRSGKLPQVDDKSDLLGNVL